jgi:hypothetical protein
MQFWRKRDIEDAAELSSGLYHRSVVRPRSALVCAARQHMYMSQDTVACSCSRNCSTLARLVRQVAWLLCISAASSVHKAGVLEGLRRDPDLPRLRLGASSSDMAQLHSTLVDSNGFNPMVGGT